MRGYLRTRAEIITSEGGDPEQLIEQVVETPAATQMLHRFGEIVANG